MGDWRQGVFRAVDRVTPGDLRETLGRSRALRPLRDRMLRVDGRPRLARGKVTFEGLTFVFKADYRTFEHARRQGIEARTSRLIMQQAQPCDLCVDVGGNFGFLTHVMAKTVGPAGKVVTFEIDDWTAEVLRRSLVANRLASRVELFGAAGDGTGGTATVDETVAKVAGGRRVAFLKVDVDGPDYDVLRGSERTVEQWHPFLSVEMAKGRERDIYEWVAARYPHVTDVDGQPVDPEALPASMFASTEPIVIPPRSG